MIEKYDFGKLRVGGKEYRRDVIIYPEGDSGSERVNPSWWRKEGHRMDKGNLGPV